MIRQILYWFVLRRWLLAAFTLVGTVAVLPVPEGLSQKGMYVLAIALGALICFVTEPIPLPTIAFLIAIAQVLFGIDTPKNVAKSFMSDSVFFIMGSLMLAAAIVKQNLERRIAYQILRISGPNIYRISIGFITVCALIASFIGEHTVAAIMLPVAMTLIVYLADDPKTIRNVSAILLFSIAYGCSISSIGTPSGGARNAIMLDYWKRLYNIEISYIDWIKYAYPMVLLQIPFLAFVLKITFKPEKKNLIRATARLRAQIQEQGKMTPKDWLTVGIFLFTLFLWMTVSNKLGLGVIALIGVSLYLIAGLVKWDDLNQQVNWGVILIYAASISLGVAMERTGAAEWLAHIFVKVINTTGIQSNILIIAFISIVTALAANVMSHGPAVAVIGPIALGIAKLSGISLISAGFAVAISSAFSYLTVIGSPAATIIYSSGYLKPTDYIKTGWKMVVLSIGMLLVFSATYWVFLGL